MSDERFRLLVESVCDHGIFMLDPTGRVATWNVGAERLKGYRAEEILGQHFSRFYPPEDVAAGKPAYELEVATREGRFEDDGWRLRKDGSRFWANVVITALWDPDGGLVGFAKVTRDLTERKRAEEDRLRHAADRAARAEAEAMQRRTALLAETSRLLAAAFDDASLLPAVARAAVPGAADACVVLLLEPDGKGGSSLHPAAVAHVDPAKEPVLRALPPRPFDAAGADAVAAGLRAGRPRSVPDLGHADAARAVGGPAALAALRAAGLGGLVVAPLIGRDRTLGALLLGVAEGTGRGQAPADLLLADQLAGRVALGVDNARLYREAQGALRAQEAFLARASHELRTPLTSALAALRLLRRLEALGPPERAAELLDLGSRGLTAMARLVTDLLEASAASLEGAALEVQPIDLGALVRQGLGAVAARAREVGISLRAELPAGLHLVADPRRLAQVVTHLLANAIEATPAGGQVSVEAEAAHGRVVLRVRDTGDGIPGEYLERVFEPFVQVPRGRPLRGRGSGLGLAISRQLVARHGGTIRAESAGPGRGATFVVTLPLPADPAA